MTDDKCLARIEALKAKAKARRNRQGYKQNVEEIDAEIARLEAMNGDPA